MSEVLRMTEVAVSGMMPLLLLLISAVIFCAAADLRRYYKSMYRHETKNSYFKVAGNKGLRGEYITSKFLNKIRGYKKFVFNVYIPEGRSERYTEIDIIMVHEKGIFVVENKNYSGWIYGKEKDNKWCQSLNRNTRYYFYNPVKQNETHIRYLRHFIREWKDVTCFSVIAFNNNAKLKKITIDSDYTVVCNSSALKGKTGKKMRRMEEVLSIEDIDAIYDILKNKTGVSVKVKRRHIKDIRKNYK